MGLYKDEYLAYTADGKARMVSTYMASDLHPSFTYWECDSGCTDTAANWVPVQLYPHDDPIGFALDPQGRPRALVWDSGWSDPAPGIVQDTYNYVWCDADCLTAANWHASTIGTPTGEVPDLYQQAETRLAIDGTGRPYVAYHYNDAYDANNGLRWYYCAQGCQADGDNSANWQRQYVETTDTLEASDPVAVAPGWMVSRWSEPGRYPRLAFDAADNVMVVYGNEHLQARTKSQSDPTMEYLTDLMLARLRLLSRP